MGASKNQFFPKNQNQTASLCKAMAHPARVAIIEHLIAVHRCIGDEFLEIVPLSQPSISRHINELVGAGLISSTFENNAYTYEISPPALHLMGKYFSNIALNFSQS
jgi:DNA-binding transcriptional ArsR family regulator